jgi:beta-1,4-mannosyltransferase
VRRDCGRVRQPSTVDGTGLGDGLDEGRVRVLHVPGGHGYVANIQDERVGGVAVVAEPRAAGSGWAPSPALEAAWVDAHAATFDVLHLHFGFESRTPAQLADWLGALRRRGRASVLTVHDLQNPHLTDQAPHDALLDVLVPGVDGLVTLTPGAADEVERRWGRRPLVVAHPHLAPLAQVGLPRPAHPGAVVGLHLKSLRANLLALPALRTLAAAVRRLPGTRLRVDVHAEALAPSFPRHDPDLTRWLRAAGAEGVDVRVHDRFDDDELTAYLRELDVSVLAYGHGTHSGWLELCHDLGVPVLAARTGHLDQQRALVQVDLTDEEEVVAGLRRALAGFPGAAATREERDAERRRVAQAHRDLYRRVTGTAGGIA